uniref:Uncharacterized protein n=1 Tax=Arundo donax TaxID=35708 RepID=A0A0A9FBG9_ARUDO
MAEAHRVPAGPPLFSEHHLSHGASAEQMNGSALQVGNRAHRQNP